MTSKHLKTVGQTPLERYATTYSSDYKPFRERYLQVNHQRPRTEAKAAPAFLNPPQTQSETWPIFHQYFYKTTNSTYGSSSRSQPPSCSLLPTSLHPFGILAEAPGLVGSSLTEARTQEVGASREHRPLFGEEERGQLHYVFGGKANAFEQQEAKYEPQQKMDVLYEEGVIVLSSLVGPTCCEDFLRSVCREVGLQRPLHLPVTSSSVITIKDAENWANCAYFRGLGPAIGLQNSTFFQPSSRHCSCCAWETECPNSCCFKMQTVPPCAPRSSTLPPAHVKPTFYCTEPSRKPPLTEYQAKYTAEWAQPRMQQSGNHHQHLCH